MLDRRHLLKALAATGIGTAVFHRSIVAAMANVQELDVDSIKQAEWITDLELTDDQRKEILNSVRRTNASLASLRKVTITPDIPMAIRFSPTSHFKQLETVTRCATPIKSHVIELPHTEEEIAFLPVHQLAWLVRTQKLSSLDLTNIYLNRLKKYGPMLRCVVTLTEDLAIEQARRADSEISNGQYRGPLHGIPWGAKDLMAVKGYPTSWGIPLYENREWDTTATVAQRLEDAGAVLLGKLSLGALANGDVWFRGKTRSPWNPKVGSSGSSAGSACCSVGGLVGFALGTETLGSIVSPSRRCGASSLRPTFGRVSRFGCMPLSWSLDKIGPICRSIEDCALVFDAIHGSDGKDLSTGSYPFCWPTNRGEGKLRVGYSKSRRRPDADRPELETLKQMGCELVEIELPTEVPVGALTSIISIEAASVFDDLLREGKTEGWNSWDKDFRAAQYISAVDYVRIQRARTMLIRQFEESIADVDLMVNMNDLVHTNFTGHPSVVLPVGYTERNGGRSPQSVIFTGHLNDDERLLAVAQRFQSLQNAHLEHPQLEPWREEFDAGITDGLWGNG